MLPELTLALAGSRLTTAPRLDLIRKECLGCLRTCRSKGGGLANNGSRRATGSASTKRPDNRGLLGPRAEVASAGYGGPHSNTLCSEFRQARLGLVER